MKERRARGEDGLTVTAMIGVAATDSEGFVSDRFGSDHSCTVRCSSLWMLKCCSVWFRVFSGSSCRFVPFGSFKCFIHTAPVQFVRFGSVTLLTWNACVQRCVHACMRARVSACVHARMYACMYSVGAAAWGRLRGGGCVGRLRGGGCVGFVAGPCGC